MSDVMTIGYEGTDPERFTRALKESRVDLLVDIRMVAFSHKPGFSGAPLRQAMEEAGIGYLHLQDLGNPKAGRDAAKAGDIASFHRIYRTQMGTSAAQRAVSRVIELSRSRRPCLMCFERDHRDCHRGMVAETLESHEIRVVHLTPDLRHTTHKIKDSAQGRLF